MLVEIAKLINPMTLATYGRVLDGWLTRPADWFHLAYTPKLVSPSLVSAYTPAPHAWARGRFSA